MMKNLLNFYKRYTKFLFLFVFMVAPSTRFFAAPGDLDPSFNSIGVQPGTMFAPVAQSSESLAIAVAIDADGKIFMAGKAKVSGNDYFALIRLDAQGLPDADFGFFGSLTQAIVGQGNESNAKSIFIQPSDKKIIAAGFANIGGPKQFALARFLNNGILDTTFGVNGTLTTTVAVGGSSEIFSVALDSSEKIIAAGYVKIGGYEQFALAKYQTNGQLDLTFGVNGIVATQIATSTDNCRVNSVAIASDGKIVAAGHVEIAGATKIAVARYDANGNLDTTFNTTGKKIITSVDGGFGNQLGGQSVNIDENQKIVVAGFGLSLLNGFKFVVVRLNDDGSLDTSFNPSGAQPGTVAFSINTADSSYLNSSAIQSDGKIVLAGYIQQVPNDYFFCIARLNSDGTLDQTFAASGPQPGVKLTRVSNINYALGYSVAIQPSDGKIVAAG